MARNYLEAWPETAPTDAADWRDDEINRLLYELDRERTARQAAESRLALFDPAAEARQRAGEDAR